MIIRVLVCLRARAFSGIWELKVNIFCTFLWIWLTGSMSVVSTPNSRPLQWSSPVLGHKMTLSATSTPLLGSIQSNDDEQERRQRRRSRVIDLHAGADSSINEVFRWVHLGPNPIFVYNHIVRILIFETVCLIYSNTGTPAAVPKLSSAQISEHYSTCIKLSTENVSEKHTKSWTIPLVLMYTSDIP